MENSIQYMNSRLAALPWEFEIPPAPIPEAQIKETIRTELVVVGEGLAGLSTALSAVQSGVDTLIVTASSHPVGRGGSVFAAYSKVMEREGFPRAEVENFFLEEFAAASFHVDQRKWYKFYNHSEEAMNWLIDILEAGGMEVVLEDAVHDDPASPSHQPAGTHTFLTAQQTVPGFGIVQALGVLEKNYLAAGGKVAYKKRALRLERADGGRGRVTAVLAEDTDGRFVRYAASKAVVLATGDFSANREMMAKYCPQFAKYYTNEQKSYNIGFQSGGLFRGEGHLMALWAGAAWQRTQPNAVMIQGSLVCSNMPYGTHRGLRLNVRGERYCNEDMNAPYTAQTVLREPEQKAYAIWGSNYARDIPWYDDSGLRGQPPISPDEVLALWEKHVAHGDYIRCDTVEEVVERLGLPKETAMAEIERYNAMCRAGQDEDFHKKAKYMTQLRSGPFYGAALDQFYFFTVLGGPRTDHNLRICDENDVPLGGLYCVGSMVGDMFANLYNFRIAGHNYGASLTFGYLTGKYIAEHEPG